MKKEKDKSKSAKESIQTPKTYVLALIGGILTLISGIILTIAAIGIATTFAIIFSIFGIVFGGIIIFSSQLLKKSEKYKSGAILLIIFGFLAILPGLVIGPILSFIAGIIALNLWYSSRD